MDGVMAKDRDEQTGKYTERYAPEEFLSALGSLGGSAGTQELADEVGCAYRTAHAKLTAMEEAGKITSRQVGNAKLWELNVPESE
jgi:predicted transcriptional regulator